MESTAKTTPLPPPRPIEIDYRNGMVSYQKIWVYKVEVKDVRQLDVSIHIGSENYVKISTPPYAIRPTWEEEMYYLKTVVPKMFDELVEFFIGQLKSSTVEWPIEPIHKDIIESAYDYACPRVTAEVSTHHYHT